MKAKLVRESLTEESHEDRMRRRRAEHDRESRDMRRQGHQEKQETRAMMTKYQKSVPKEEEVRYGRINVKRLTPEEKKQQKREEALERIAMNHALIKQVNPSPEGVKELEDFREDGEPMPPKTLVLRTQMGDGPVIAYDQDADKGQFTTLGNALKTDYKIAYDQEYENVRPIQYQNWLKKDFEGKISTLKDGEKQTRKRKKRPEDIIGPGYD